MTALEDSTAIPESMPIETSPGKPGFFSVGPVVNGDWPLQALLRLILALGVVAGHLVDYIDIHSAYPESIQWLASLGTTSAVMCFFILSGYVIAHSVEHQPGQFSIRRAIRIYPTYWICLMLAIIPFALWKLRPGSPIELTSLSQFGIPALAMQAIGLPWIIGQAIPTFNPSWSLTCEIVYYAIAPVLNRLRFWLTALLAIASFAVSKIAPQIWSEESIWPIFGLAYIWLIGWLYYRYKSNWYAPVLFAVAIFLVIPTHDRSNFIVFGLTFLCLVCAKHTRIPSGVAKIFDFCGDISYPLYLSHVAVILTVAHFYPSAVDAYPGLCIVAPVIVASVIYLLADRPARRALSARLLRLHHNSTLLTS